MLRNTVVVVLKQNKNTKLINLEYYEKQDGKRTFTRREARCSFK